MFHSLKTKIAATYSAIIVLSFFAMFLLVYRASLSILRNEIEYAATQAIHEYAAYVGDTMDQIYNLAGVILNSQTIKVWYAQTRAGRLPHNRQMLLNRTVSQEITLIANSYPVVDAIAVLGKDGLYIDENNHIVLHSGYEHTAWFKAFRTHAAYWIPVYDNQGRRYQQGDVISFLVPIGTFEPTHAQSVLKIDIRVGTFQDLLTQPQFRMLAVEDVFLLNHQGVSMLSNRYPGDAGLRRSLEEAVHSEAQNGVMYVSTHRGRYMVMYDKLPTSGWTVAALISEARIFSSLDELRQRIVQMTLLLLGLTVVVSFLLSYRMTNALSRLVRAMRLVKRGGFEPAEHLLAQTPLPRDEIGVATEAFLEMVQELKEHIRREVESHALRQRAEYKALLMQINPHFLFNTLEMMSSLALQGRTEDILTVIEAMGKMLRFSLRSDSDLVDIHEELSYIDHYLAILQLRYKERLQIHKEISADLGHVRVIKFLLQPLVENAVKFTLPYRPVCQLRIRVQAEDGLRVEVSDNGIGMPPELVQQLADGTYLDELWSTGEQRIGLRNVLGRCRMHYGERFHCHVASSPQHGTSITLVLPVVRDASG
ncbi:hypothetical protein GCM10010885_06620 [Alicyclobacillus cellulosilyticus]|uniref:HAMP domain-containing protein n=1 Tax=Alicyclobacillus cellulosilyticus TaxID=1003997 RepID=A0A917K4P9_9BACL|nr:sensor histidine kinase [Alicyclobacillus cellulosilyticus]GGJ00020.1 hypothetical protein GCM10010885_06620 [Alicyclobacillus cellulosilyticus]